LSHRSADGTAGSASVCGNAVISDIVPARRDGAAPASDRLSPDGFFTDLIAGIGRRSEPPSVVALMMDLQRLEGLSDRQAVDRFAVNARRRRTCGIESVAGIAPAGPGSRADVQGDALINEPPHEPAGGWLCSLATAPVRVFAHCQLCGAEVTACEPNDHGAGL
jgi:hypothetical protein